MEPLLFHTLPPELNRMLQGYCEDNIKVEYKGNRLNIVLSHGKWTETYSFCTHYYSIIQFLSDIKKQVSYCAVLCTVKDQSPLIYEQGVFSISMPHKSIDFDKNSSAKILEKLYQIIMKMEKQGQTDSRMRDWY